MSQKDIFEKNGFCVCSKDSATFHATCCKCMKKIGSGGVGVGAHHFHVHYNKCHAPVVVGPGASAAMKAEAVKFNNAAQVSLNRFFSPFAAAVDGADEAAAVDGADEAVEAPSAAPSAAPLAGGQNAVMPGDEPAPEPAEAMCLSPAAAAAASICPGADIRPLFFPAEEQSMDKSIEDLRWYLPTRTPDFVHIDVHGNAHFRSCIFKSQPLPRQPPSCADLLQTSHLNVYSKRFAEFAAAARKDYRNITLPPGRHHVHYSPSQLSAQIGHLHRVNNLQALEMLNMRRRANYAEGRIEQLESLQEAIATSNFHRVHAVLSAARKRGLGVAATKALLADAVANVYRPRQWADCEVEFSHAIWCMSGYNIATVVSKSLGFPAVSTMRRAAKNWRYQLAPASSFLTIVPALEKSVTSLSKLRALQTSDNRFPMPCSLMIDEVAVVRRAMYDRDTGCVIGSALRPGVPGFVIEVEDDIDNFVAALKKGELTLASLASVVGVAPLMDGPRFPMACAPISVFGSPARGRTAEHELPLFVHTIKIAHERLKAVNQRVMQSKLIHTTANIAQNIFNTLHSTHPPNRPTHILVGSDGDGPRSRCIASLTVKALPRAEELLLSGLDLLDKKTMVYGICGVRDPNHICKRQVQVPRTRGMKFGNGPYAHLNVAEIDNGLQLAGGLSDCEVASLMNPKDKMRVSVAQKFKKIATRFCDL